MHVLGRESMHIPLPGVFYEFMLGGESNARQKLGSHARWAQHVLSIACVQTDEPLSSWACILVPMHLSNLLVTHNKMSGKLCMKYRKDK